MLPHCSSAPPLPPCLLFNSLPPATPFLPLLPIQGVAKVGAVDVSRHKNLGAQYHMHGPFTIKVFGGNKQSPMDYQGGYTLSVCVCVCVGGGWGGGSCCATSLQ